MKKRKYTIEELNEFLNWYANEIDFINSSTSKSQFLEDLEEYFEGG